MRKNQSGGIVSFVVVGLVLTGLLVGGLYWSKSAGRQARDNDTTTPTVSVQDEETTQEQPAPSNTEEQAAPTNNTATQQPMNTQLPQPTTQSGAATNRVANTGPSDEIPATGPAETGFAVIAFAGLTFAVYLAIDARRSLRRSALGR